MQTDLFERVSVPRAYFRLAVPVVLAMVVSVVYNIVDAWFIALTGDTTLVAGVQVCTPLFILMIALGDIWGLGGASLMSRLLGRKDSAAASSVSAFCFYMAAACGLAFMVLLLVFRVPILRLLGADDQTLPHASAYYFWIALGAPFVILSMTPNNQLRTEGLATQGMVGAIMGSAVNIILDPIFIFTLGMGAGGAALATMLSNVLTDAWYVWLIRRRCRVVSVSPGLFRFDTGVLREVFAVGIPAAVTNIMSSLSMALTNRFLLPYGNERIAALGVAGRVNMISSMVLIGFAFGGQPLVGYNYGAKNEKRLRETLRFAYGFETAMALTLAAVLSLFAPQLIRAFIDDPAIIEYGSAMLRCLQAGAAFMGVVLVSTCYFQATGQGPAALILSASRQGVIFLLVILIASHLLGYTGVILTQAIADALTAVLAVALMRRHKP